MSLENNSILIYFITKTYDFPYINIYIFFNVSGYQLQAVWCLDLYGVTLMLEQLLAEMLLASNIWLVRLLFLLGFLFFCFFFWLVLPFRKRKNFIWFCF